MVELSANLHIENGVLVRLYYSDVVIMTVFNESPEKAVAKALQTLYDMRVACYSMKVLNEEDLLASIQSYDYSRVVCSGGWTTLSLRENGLEISKTSDKSLHSVLEAVKAEAVCLLAVIQESIKLLEVNHEP